jgi:tRNA A58 N-methylase Trm61
MERKPEDAVKIVDYEKQAAREHHHRGKSSESLLDKEIILAALRIAPGQTVLDAGCGNGYMSKAFSRLVGEAGSVYGVTGRVESGQSRAG